MLQHSLPIRVYYEDTDAGGIVYHANYLKFFERARVEALRTCGFELNKLLFDYDTQFVVHSAELEFLQSARLDQLLYVITEIREVRHASIFYNQRVCLEAVDGLLLCKAKIHLACLGSNQRPKGLPAILKKEIQR